MNFFRNYSEEKFNAFLKYAIYSSGRGERGQQGGSITYSHAFANGELMDRYRSRYGDTLIKDDINCVFWKESYRTSLQIRENDVDLKHLFSINDKLKFLMPVRNPLDCAASNMKTGHYKLFPGLSNGASFFDVLNAVLDEYRWFIELAEEYPKRFFLFFENEFGEDVLKHIAEFLGVRLDQGWLDDCLAMFRDKSSYNHPPGYIDYYHSQVADKFTNFPKASQRLIEFVGTPV